MLMRLKVRLNGNTELRDVEGSLLEKNIAGSEKKVLTANLFFGCFCIVL